MVNDPMMNVSHSDRHRKARAHLDVIVIGQRYLSIDSWLAPSINQ
jgi:hypothetical protein